MQEPRRPDEPRLTWAYVPASAASTASAPLPDFGPSTRWRVAEKGGVAEEYRLSPVTLWSHLPPRARPDSLCPVCLEPVTLKLGQRKRHHYAHLPTSRCAASTPEGALHLAAKLRLAQQLAKGGQTLPLRRLCRGAPQERPSPLCTPGPVTSIEVAWDRVEVERSLPSLRADLLLLQGSEPRLAIEVCATHEVDLDKGEKYRCLGLPWLEVDAARIVPEEGNGWIPGEPLPLLGDSELHPERWRCPRHAALFLAYEEHQRNGVHRTAWRVVHLYRGDGGRSAGEVRTDSVLISMMERREEGEVVEGWLQRDERADPLSRPVAVMGREALRETLHRDFVRWVRWTSRTRGARVDSPMRWADHPPPVGIERDRLYPQRFRFDARTGEFVGAPGLPALSWPLPLRQRAEPHPLFGHAPVYWTELSFSDRGVLLNALSGSTWLTVRPQEWTDPASGHRRVRADFELHRHDGRRWRSLLQAAFVRTWRLTRNRPEIAWEEILPAVVSVAEAHVEEIVRGRTSLADLVAPLLPRAEEDSA